MMGYDRTDHTEQSAKFMTVLGYTFLRSGSVKKYERKANSTYTHLRGLRAHMTNRLQSFKIRLIN